MRLLVAVLTVAVVCPVLSAQDSKRVGDMSVARASAAAAVLPDGRILVTGGAAGSTAWSTAEIYDPATARFSATGTMNSTRMLHTATTLRDGRVLIVGGRDRVVTAAAQLVPFVETYDPATGTFVQGTTMIQPRYDHSAALLSDGRVLIAGGTATSSGASIALAEVYDPQTGQFSPAGTLDVARTKPFIGALPGGRAIIGGGTTSTGGSVQYPTSSQLYDRTSGFAGGPTTILPRASAPSLPLPDGRVLIVSGTGGPAALFINSAEAYNPASNRFEFVAGVNVARHSHSATLLPTGSVVIAGGVTQENGRGLVTGAIEVLDATASDFRIVGKLAIPRQRQMTALLPNGGVLFAGGVTDLGGTATATAEVWRADAFRRRIARGAAGQ